MTHHPASTDAERVTSVVAAIRHDPAHVLLASDVDGTLAPIAPHPAAARVHPAAPGVLRALAHRLGAIAIITGRPPLDAARLLGFARPDGTPDDVPHTIEVVGHYGMQRWSPADGLSPVAAPEAIQRARQRVDQILAGAPSGTLLEDKGIALALHVRQTADPLSALAQLRGPLEEVARECGLRLEAGRLVWELRPAGADKGSALRRLVDVHRPRVVVYIGDDAADRAAFAVIAELPEVLGLRICSASQEVSELRAVADLVVDGPDGVVSWLTELAQVLGVSADGSRTP
ncbi:trehalose 6-phosphatase [Acidothermus cellulolyticus 11B]|uniref:Trehalose 6-phosphate phosphatase n=1 Tax=Acidothermus cellulolyticus (strain ATCC 43068 / DSM 8971 / 11B) TaxID=351607 RepID=A0LR15_ACIC1|nr:trehalose-phosphatase [Acidothermus cellulolyticus]ABK51875.1 trehalose 6-phosphatase [Acidothermus cellulolyticus 11B]